MAEEEEEEEQHPLPAKMALPAYVDVHRVRYAPYWYRL